MKITAGSKSGHRHKGFTLVEMIISIGVVAIFSGLVIQLFITAKNLDKLAHDTDIAVSTAANITEIFKSGGSAADFTKNEIIKEMETSVSQAGNTEKMTVYFNDDWKPVLSPGSASFIMNAEFKLTENDPSYGDFYDITVRVTTSGGYDIKNKQNVALTEIVTEKWFTAGSRTVSAIGDGQVK